jgi:hypothetical protein
MLRPTAVLLLLLSSQLPSFAWGPKGHRVIADVATHHLNAAARQQLTILLGSDDLDLASISTWADEIRNQRPDTFGWHFVDIPWNAAGFSETRDCNGPEGHRHRDRDLQNCVVDRIAAFQQILSDRYAGKSARLEALKFLVHFIADVHQPMHAMGEARGGNDIQISQFGRTTCGSRSCNLHSLWDLGLIDHTRRPEPQYVEHLEQLIIQHHLQSESHGSPADWANESFHLARRVWLKDGEAADENYYRQNIDSLDRQLALAGLRLAMVLDQALDYDHPVKMRYSIK